MSTVMLTALRSGCTLVTMPKFEPMALLETLAKYRVSYASLVPPIVAFLARHPAVAKFDLSALKVVFSGAAPLDSETQAALEARLPGVRVAQGYGMTESSPVTHFMDPRYALSGSVGPLAPSTSARIVDVDSGAVLPPGAANVGELWVRGPQVMAGYLNNAAADAATLRDGWLMTGDIAWADEQGAFYIVDRRKELIKCKGFQVAPAELEGLLINHPGVAAAAVIGAPDERAGELPVAFVVTRAALLRSMGRAAEAAALPAVSAAELAAHVAGRVAPFKQLAAVLLVEAGGIPKSPAGKVLRRLLRERAADAVKSGEGAVAAVGELAAPRPGAGAGQA
jgi:acyl-CoA synthetase (AMP-forming)/AMP-acid ligase II